MIRSLVFACAALLALAASPVFAQSKIMTAPQAASAVKNAEMILIDIRRPSEWKETGVAKGAVALSMHTSEFPQQITGLICATGGRTEYVTSLLAQNGFANVVDVSEGMFGNGEDPGWLARGMPLISSQEAQSAYRRLVQNP